MAEIMQVKLTVVESEMESDRYKTIFFLLMQTNFTTEEDQRDVLCPIRPENRISERSLVPS